MAKQITKSAKMVPSSPEKTIFHFSLRAKYCFLAIIGFLFYLNTMPNKYALDDNLIILQNVYVKMGFAGIPKILTSDSYAGYYASAGGDMSGQLSGGRYRPLSEIIFATEQQLLGNSILLPWFRHLINVLAYVACIMAIYYFLEKFLFKKIPGGGDVAFLSTFLFVIHPIHTEVVANIKSLDEILSLLFIMLTFINSLKYLGSNRIKHLSIATSSFFMALLSKEYAVTLLFSIPFLFYLLKQEKPISAIKASFPYYGIFIIYLLLRYYAVGFHSYIQSTNVIFNPYMYASYSQKIATEWFVMGKYFRLLFFPYPLACDYSYNQITYHSFSDITVLLSILIYIVIFIWGVILAIKKSVLSFAVLFFLLTSFLISNFALNIGATMGERLIFHSSLGFVIMLSWYVYKAVSKAARKPKRSVVTGVMLITGAACFGETFTRNMQWKNDASLSIHDVEVVPNSFLMNNNAGYGYLGLSQEKETTAEQSKLYLDSAHKYLRRALFFNQNYFLAYLNLGIVCRHQGQPDSAKYCFDMVEKLYHGYPGLDINYALLSQQYFAQGLLFAMKSGKPREGIIFMRKAIMLDSANASIWYNMAIAYYQEHEYDSARYAFTKTLQNKPDSMEATNAKKDLQDLSQMK